MTTASAQIQTTPANVQAFTVWAGGAAWALPANAVQTVFRITSITRVPLAPLVIEGLVNLRGRVVIAIDLARRVLGTVDITPAKEPQVLAVAVECGSDVFALVVDAVGDVVIVDDAERIDAPANLPTDIATMTTSWFRTQDGLLPLLDINRVLELEPDRRSGCDRRAHNPLSTGAKP